MVFLLIKSRCRFILELAFIWVSGSMDSSVLSWFKAMPVNALVILMLNPSFEQEFCERSYMCQTFRSKIGTCYVGGSIFVNKKTWFI